MMGIALGGLGVLTLRLPQDVSLHQLVDLPTLLLAALLVFILSLIAYFTNPSEASFRVFLTELAFRQHLSRLSDVQEGDQDDDDDDYRLARPIDYKGPRKKPGPSHPRGASQHDSPVVFHFANKASVSLRTPGYRFRTFAVLTVAIVTPTELALAGAQPPRTASSASPSPAQQGACFVGAFGHWWLALEMRMLPRQVRLTAQDNDSASSPDTPLARSSDDHAHHHHHHHHQPAPVKLPRPHRAPLRTKAALRERLSLHTSSMPPRPTTPPPLPKSASLPLHGPPPAPPLLPPAVPAPPAPSPALADLLAQLDAARAATADLHAQLAASRAAPAHAALHAAVATARETKKREDANRAGVKARTKALDDARRQADAGKREAEKRLKAATHARDGAAGRIERLERDIAALRARMQEDAERMEVSATESAAERVHLMEEIETRRREVGEAEEAVGTLAGRARELEGAVARETARLEALKARPRSAVGPGTGTSAWPPALPPLRAPNPPAAPNGTVHGLDAPFSPFSASPAPALSPVSTALLPSSLVQSIESPREALFARAHPFGPAPRSAPTSPIDPPFAPRLPAADEERPRWFAPPAAPREKGLNPTAKVFTLPPRRHDPPQPHAFAPFFPDAPFAPSTPNMPFVSPAAAPAPASPVPAPAPASSPGFFSALHSAFAPSPAEREALQRALEEGAGSGHSTPLVRTWDREPSRAVSFNPWGPGAQE